jgi:hypothetical protein
MVLFDQAKPIQTGLSVHAGKCCAKALAINNQPACVDRNDGQSLSAVWLGLIRNMNHMRVPAMTASSNNNNRVT